MNRCKTCKHWTPEEDRFENVGTCYHDKLAEYTGRGSCAPDALIYPYDEGAGHFWTGPEFGCVHHEEKQP